LNKAYESLEWCLTSPPKPHAFVSLPTQSSILGSIVSTSGFFFIVIFFL